MKALIYVDLSALRPIVDGQWHRAHLSRVPAPGEQIVLLCGRTAPAVFESIAARTMAGIPTCCWECDLVYRRQCGIAVYQQ